MEPTIYKPKIYKPGAYNSPGIYNGAGGIYKGLGVYNDGAGGGSFPENLISLFYGDYVQDGNIYKHRFINPNYIDREANWNHAANISQSLYEVTPLGNIVVFKQGNTTNQWYCSAAFKTGTKLFNFTIEYWLKYIYSWGERCQIGQINYSYQGSDSWFVTGPCYNTGIYYNGGNGGLNFTNLFNFALDGSWHHLEYDVDIDNHTLKIYADGEYKTTITLSQKISQVTRNDEIKYTLALNDGRNHPEVTYTQLAFWDKLMDGSCYSKGLYHDGNKFLI